MEYAKNCTDKLLKNYSHTKKKPITIDSPFDRYRITTSIYLGYTSYSELGFEKFGIDPEIRHKEEFSNLLVRELFGCDEYIVISTKELLDLISHLKKALCKSNSKEAEDILDDLVDDIGYCVKEGRSK